MSEQMAILNSGADSHCICFSGYDYCTNDDVCYCEGNNKNQNTKKQKKEDQKYEQSSKGRGDV